MHRHLVSALLGAGLAIAAASAQAGERLPQDIARRLDKAPAAFSMSEAKRERLMMIQESMARQRYYGGHGGYGGGYAAPYGRPYGYGGVYDFYDLHPQRRPLNGYERGYYGR